MGFGKRSGRETIITFGMALSRRVVKPKMRGQQFSFKEVFTDKAVMFHCLYSTEVHMYINRTYMHTYKHVQKRNEYLTVCNCELCC